MEESRCDVTELNRDVTELCERAIKKLFSIDVHRGRQHILKKCWYNLFSAMLSSNRTKRKIKNLILKS